MPRATYHPRSAKFKELRSASHEPNNCSVIAVAAATGLPFETVNEVFTAKGRRYGRGTPVWMTESVIAELGYKFERIPTEFFTDQYPGKKSPRVVTSHHPDRYHRIWADGNNYILYNRTHMLAVCNGVNIDWSRGRSLRAKWIWKITKGENA